MAQNIDSLSHLTISIVDTLPNPTIILPNRTLLPKDAVRIRDEYGQPTSHYRVWKDIAGRSKRVAILGTQTQIPVDAYSYPLVSSKTHNRLYNVGYFPIIAQSGLIHIELFDLAGKLIKRKETDIIGLPMSAVRTLAADGSFWIAGIRYEALPDRGPRRIDLENSKNRLEILKTKLVVAHFDKNGNLLKEIETPHYNLGYINGIIVSPNGQYVMVQTHQSVETAGIPVYQNGRQTISSPMIASAFHNFYFSTSGVLIHQEETKRYFQNTNTHSAFIGNNIFFNLFNQDLEIRQINEQGIKQIVKIDTSILLNDKVSKQERSRLIQLEQHKFAFLANTKKSNKDYILVIFDGKANQNFLNTIQNYFFYIG